MNFDEFKKQVLEDVLHSFESVTVDVQEVSKLQGQSYTGLTVRPEGKTIGATMNLDAGFAQYQKTGDYEATFAAMESAVRSGLENMPDISVSSLTSYETMKDKLTIQLIPTELNKEMLENIPHQEMEDMSVVYRFQLDSNEHGNATILVTNAVLDTLGITAEQLHQDAMAIAPLNNPAQVRNMAEVMAEMMGMEPEMLGGADSPMFVASSPNMTNGAGVIAYPDFMEQTSEKLGGDFYILPSSVHEVILVRDDGSLSDRQLSAMVNDVNEQEVAPEERLSNHAFHYDSKDHIFERASSFEQRMTEKQMAKEMAPVEKGKIPAEKEPKGILKDLSEKKEKAKAQIQDAPKKKPKQKER